jgi:hypothetical protein
MRTLLCSLSLFLTLACCGYSVKALLPPHLRTIAILPVENQTVKPNLETELSQRLVDDFRHDGSLRQTDPEHADVVLRCAISGYDKTPQAYTSGQTVNTWVVTVTAHCECQDQVKSVRLWSGRVSMTATLDATGAESAGIDEALSKLSAEIVRRTLIAW